MTLNLPNPVAAYFTADKADSDTLSRCFTDDAVVKDERHRQRTSRPRRARQIQGVVVRVFAQVAFAGGRHKARQRREPWREEAAPANLLAERVQQAHRRDLGHHVGMTPQRLARTRSADLGAALSRLVAH